MQNGTQTPARQNSDTARSENYTYPKNTSAKRHAAGHAFPEIDTAALSFFKNLHPAKFPPFIMHFCFPEVYSRWIFVSMARAPPAPYVAPLTQKSICCFYHLSRKALLRTQCSLRLFLSSRHSVSITHRLSCLRRVQCHSSFKPFPDASVINYCRTFSALCCSFRQFFNSGPHNPSGCGCIQAKSIRR